MIGAIEQAMINRVNAAASSNALGYALTAQSYAGELDADGGGEVRNFPAVWITFAGERPDAQGPGRSTWMRAVFTAFCAQRNRRNDAASRHGAAGKVGAYQLLEDVRAVLLGQTLDLEISPLAPGAVRTIIAGKLQGEQAVVYAVEFTTRYALGSPPASDGLDDFKHVHLDYDVPPHGNVAPPLPAETPDTADDLILQP